MVSGEESAEEPATEVCSSAGAGATAARRSTQHSKTRRRPVQQGAASRRQGSAAVCDQRMTEEGPGDQDRARQCSGRVYKHRQQLLPGRDCQVSCSMILSRQIQAHSCFVWISVIVLC